jgi:hypothetical protein
MLTANKLYQLILGLTVFFALTTIFALVNFFPTMVCQLGAPTTYCSFAAVCFALAAFTHLFIPETKEKKDVEGDRGNISSREYEK